MSTYTLLGNSGYSKDKNRIYWEYGTTDGAFIKLVSGVDPETFRFLEFGLAKDKQFVYYQGIVVHGLDPKSVSKYSDYEAFEEKRRK